MTGVPLQEARGLDLSQLVMGDDPLVTDPDELPPRRKLHRPEPAPMVLNIVSMIDVIFLLMTYFLLTAKFTTREESFQVNVPERLEGSASPPGEPPADPFELPKSPVTLSVVSKGDGAGEFAVFCDSPAIAGSGPITDYEGLFQRAESARDKVLAVDQRFVIRPAPDTRWEHALGVLNALKRAGFNNVRFANPGRIAGSTGG